MEDLVFMFEWVVGCVGFMLGLGDFVIGIIWVLVGVFVFSFFR